MLPKVETITYEVTIPELPTPRIKYRPFKVGEHKTFLTAVEMKDETALVNTIVDLVNKCTFNKLDLDKLPAHVVDYLYLLIHSKSTGNQQQAHYTCNNQILQEDQTFKKCPGEFGLRLDMNNAKIVYPPDYESKRIVMVNDTVGIKLKVPNFEELRKIKLDKSVLEITDEYIFICVESIFNEEKVDVPGVDFSHQELVEWLNDLDGEVMDKISVFFQSLPVLGLDVNITCPLCGKKEVIELRGLDAFFD